MIAKDEAAKPADGNRLHPLVVFTLKRNQNIQGTTVKQNRNYRSKFFK